jgi:tol-pal system protein YbgF
MLALAMTGAAAQDLENATGYDETRANALLEVAQSYGSDDAGPGGLHADTAALLVRIDRLEAQVRQLTGQVEETRFTTRKLEEQLRKFQDDVEFRFQESGGHGSAPPAPASKPLQRRSQVEQPVDGRGGEPVPGSAEPTVVGASNQPIRHSDAFDPASDPTAPGAPRPLAGPLGSGGPAPALAAGDADAPLDLSGARWRAGTEPAPGTTPAVPSPAAPVSPAASQPAEVPSAATAAVPPRPAPDPVQEDYDVALGFLKQKEYESAEKGFAAFLRKYPKSKLASDAHYYLGESFFLRGRQREAAEQYLKVSTAYASSRRAPEAFLRLGQSLSVLGAKEQACAAYAKIAHEYPHASASVRSGAEREAKRARC